MSAMHIKIRRAIPLDIDWLIDQLKSFSAFLGTKKPMFGNVDYARGVLLDMIQHHVVFVAECSERGNLGFIGGLLTPHFLNPNVITQSELFWWVDPAHRHGRAGLLLLEAFIDFGKSHADWITMALEAKSPVHERCLTKRGFSLHERAYLLEVA